MPIILLPDSLPKREHQDKLILETLLSFPFGSCLQGAAGWLQAGEGSSAVWAKLDPGLILIAWLSPFSLQSP